MRIAFSSQWTALLLQHDNHDVQADKHYIDMEKNRHLN